MAYKVTFCEYLGGKNTFLRCSQNLAYDPLYIRFEEIKKARYGGSKNEKCEHLRRNLFF
jgi:hypothetical protein